MKRMLKKLSAIALAGAMVLSLCVTALATDPEPTVLTDDPNVGSATATSVASGAEQGTVRNTGPLPDDVIKIKMPLSASGVFDVYIDPHNLIRESNNALGYGSLTDASTFATDTLVYFKNTGESSTAFTKTSDDITIYNKSNVPVTVEMTAAWAKGSTSSGDAPTYDLSMNAADFAKANTEGKAALYLTMEDSRGNSDAVVEAAKGTPVLTVTTTDTDTGSGTSPANLQAAQETVKGLIKSVTFEWGDEADEQDHQLLNVGTAGKTPSDWAFTFTESTKKTPQVKLAAANLPNYTTVSGTTRNTNNAYTVVDSTAVSINETLNLDGSKSYSLPDGVENANGVVKIQKTKTGTSTKVDVAVITIEWDYEALGALANPDVPATNANPNYVTKMKAAAASGTADYTQVQLKISASSGAGGAKLETALNRSEGAYSLGEDPSTPNQLAWILDTTKFSEDSKFQNLSFNLTAAITDSTDSVEAWDTAYPTGVTGASLDVTWRVRSCKDVDPSVAVATALDSAGGTATLNVDWGFGSKLTDTITAASFVASNGQTMSLDVNTMLAIDESDHSVVTLTPGSAGNALLSGDGKVTFTFKNSSTNYTTTAIAVVKAAT